MAIYKENSQQTTLSLTTQDENGNYVQAAVVSCCIRPGRGLSINMDVFAPALIKPGNEAFNEVANEVTDYILGELVKAPALGVPINMEYGEARELDTESDGQSH